MRRNFWLRIGIVRAVIVGSLIYLYPPAFLRPHLYGAHLPTGKGGLLPPTINLGLDLQGGLHLGLGIDLEKALEAQVDRARSAVRAALEKRGVGVKRIERRGSTELVVELSTAQTWSTAQTAAAELATLETKEADRAGGRFVPAMPPREVTPLKDLAVRQGLETIRNRVDQFGVAEPSIQQQGDNRILIQLPGVQDPERATSLIGKTALLEF